MVSSTPRPYFTPGKDPVPILQEAGWAPGPVWTGGKSRPHRDSIPDRPARSSVAIPTELFGLHLKAQCLLKCAALHFGSRLQNVWRNIPLPSPFLKMNTVDVSETSMCSCQLQSATSQDTEMYVPSPLQHPMSPIGFNIPFQVRF